MHRRLEFIVLATVAAACDRTTPPTQPPSDPRIGSYVITAGGTRVDSATGETLGCQLTFNLFTHETFSVPWSGRTSLRLNRTRILSPTASIRYDTTVVTEDVEVARSARDSIRIVLRGPVVDTLLGRVDPNYPGYFRGPWTCGPDSPLARVWSGSVTGQWTSQPLYAVD